MGNAIKHLKLRIAQVPPDMTDNDVSAGSFNTALAMGVSKVPLITPGQEVVVWGNR